MTGKEMVKVISLLNQVAYLVRCQEETMIFAID